MSQSASPEGAAPVSVPERCVSCGKPMANPIGCFHCHSIFPPRSEVNHFQRLGLRPTFKIGPNDLETAYLAWSRELHPDYFQLRPAQDQHLSLTLSAALNDAYQTLRDPFRRAEYLLHLAGGPTASQQRDMPPDFLEEVLELRMEIEEARESGGDPSAIEALRNRLESQRSAAMDAVERVFAPLDAGGSLDQAALADARQTLNTVKYLDGLLRELDD